MKNLLIVGSPRCGKTTLVQMIADKYPCEIIRGDALEITVHAALVQERLHESLKQTEHVLVYPVLEDKQKIDIYKQMYKQIKIDLKGKEKLIIIDAHNLDFSLLEKEFGKEFQIYCLGVPDLTVEEFCNYIRLNDTLDDWTNHSGNSSLKMFCNTFINESKFAKETLKDFPNIKFFDTSGNRREKLEIILKDIEENVIQV